MLGTSTHVSQQGVFAYTSTAVPKADRLMVLLLLLLLLLLLQSIIPPEEVVKHAQIEVQKLEAQAQAQAIAAVQVRRERGEEWGHMQHMSTPGMDGLNGWLGVTFAGGTGSSTGHRSSTGAQRNRRRACRT